MNNTTNEIERLSAADLFALVAWLAGYQEQLNNLRYDWIAMTPDGCKEAVIGQWPIIQGTRNQINLKRLGEMPWTAEQVSRAIKVMLEANAPGSGDGERKISK